VFYQEDKPTYVDELDQIREKTPVEMYRDLDKPVGVQSVLDQYR